MSRSVVQLLWNSPGAFTFVTLSLLLLAVEVQAQQPFSSNPDDYDFGWFTVGIAESPEQLPVCKYCLNAWLAASYSDQSNLNRTVLLYRCVGGFDNEIWAYQNSSRSILFSNLTDPLCLDASLWPSQQLTLLPCNSSVLSQRWTYENNRLMNGLVDSSGNSLYMMAIPPDPGTDPISQGDGYPLFINNSIVYDNNLPSTSLFTFTSSKNIVDLSTQTLSPGAVLQIAGSPLGQVTNGGFENSTIQAGGGIRSSTSILQPAPFYFPLCGWVIDYGPIDYVRFLPAANGSLYSVHLNTQPGPGPTYSGSISQTIRTEVGKAYVLSFCMTGFPPQVAVPGRSFWNCSDSAPYDEARVQVQVTNRSTIDTISGTIQQLSTDGTIQQNFTANVTALTAQNIGWKQETVLFTASSNVTTISFTSLNFNSSCGPMIDTVDVSLVQRSSGWKKFVAVVVGSIGGLVGLIAVLGIVWGVIRWRAPEDYSSLYNIEHGRWYSVKELRIATKNFSAVLGEGGFGTVYKADFPDGTVGAVKVEKPRGPNSSSTVLASEEIVVLLRVHHRNLVNLIGFCIHKGRHMLVFEYMPNGSLHDQLHQSIFHLAQTTFTKSRAKPLELQSMRSKIIPWKQRMKILCDVACGLEYLHHEANPPIGHRDVKSQNILLTATNSAKLADFGLSRAAPIDATSFQSIETAVKGSFGYMDPQYFCTGIFSLKSDVYSFGVVLLEIITGQPAIYNATSLPMWVAPYMSASSLYHELVDKKLNGEYNPIELESLVDLAKMCLEEEGEMRPNMRQVVAFLNTRVPSLGEQLSNSMEDGLSMESELSM